MEDMEDEVNLMDVIRDEADSDHSWDAESIKWLQEVSQSHPKILDKILIAITGWSYESLNTKLRDES